jgi:hypothetical protein
MALPPHLADLEQRLANRFADAVAEYRRAAESRLRQESERWLGALHDVPVSTGTAWLDASDFATLDLAPKSEARRATLDRLAAALRALDLTLGQAEALDALLDGAHAWAGRVALVLARDSGLTAWGDRGFGDGSIAGRELDWDTTLRERLLASRGCLRLDAESAAEVLARFGANAAGDAVVVPLVLRDRIAALLWADGDAAPPETTALQILVHAAGQRLELQALTDRAYSPTLWDGADAPGEPLPLWSVLAPAAAAAEIEAAPEVAFEPAVESAAVELAPFAPEAPEAETAAAEESGAGLWEADVAAPEGFGLPVAEAPPFVAEEEAETATFTELAEPVTEPGEVSPPEAALPAIDNEAMPAFELESVEPPVEDEAARWEPEPEPPSASLPEAAPPPDATTPADLLGTVRMQLPAIEGLTRPSEETTAPLPIAATPVESAAETHEIEAPPSFEPPAAEAAPEAFSEEATQLSMRRPPLPEAPAPSAASTLALEPPTWSSAPLAAPPPPVAPAPPPEDPLDRTASRMTRSTEVAPPPDVSGPGLAFLSGRTRSASLDPAHEEAKRLARLLISEIRLYNEEQVLEGRRHRDLYHRLKEDIDRSRQIFEERVDPTVRGDVDYFQQELVRSLAGGDPRALGI